MSYENEEIQFFTFNCRRRLLWERCEFYPNLQTAFYAISFTENTIKFFWLSPSVQKPHLLNHGDNYLRKILGRLNTSREQRFLEKLTIPVTAQKFCAIYAARNFFAVVRNTTSYPHSELDQSSPYLPIIFSEVYINIIFLSRPKASQNAIEERGNQKYLTATQLKAGNIT